MMESFLKPIERAISRLKARGETPVRVYLDKEDTIVIRDPNMTFQPKKTVFGLPLAVDDLGGGSRVVAASGEKEAISKYEL